ncbi:MAG: PQQ-binding-like beta-propeller repeat protein [Planctomycetota bacterium]
MQMTFSCVALTVALFAAPAPLVSPLLADDWPQWLGPNRDTSSRETGLLRSWPEGGPPRAWLFRDCGKGYSGPAVVGGVLYILGSHDGTASLLAIDTATGAEQWRRPLAEEFTNGWGDGPRSTPCVDGNRVYAMTSGGTLACVTTAGRLVWSVAMQDLGGETPTWGYAESPLVDGRLVLCTPGGGQGAIAALDKQTGGVVWQTTGVTGNAHYSSVVPATILGVRQFVQLLPARLVGVAADDGRLLWEYPWTKPTAAIPTPLVDGNRVYATSGYGTGCACVEIAPSGSSADNGAAGGDGQEFVANEVYRNKNLKNKHGGVILLDGCVYGHSNPGGWTCQDFETGEVVWKERRAVGMGALGYADGMLYLLDKDTGDVALVEPSPEGYQERGRFTLEPQTEIRKPRGRIWVHPVVAGGKLYLRDQDLLFCFDVADQ